jgi:5-methylcytosine-specific restriction protein B
MISSPKRDSAMAYDLSNECKEVLKLLSFSKNVLISGPPGTGKSRLLAEVANAFIGADQQKVVAGPVHDKQAKVPIPATTTQTSSTSDTYPSPERKKRGIFRTVFHQNSKYREFLTGIIPNLKSTKGDTQNFKIITGTLYKASEFGKGKDAAALLIIDEINRGPAIQIFGGSIVALEADKRLSPSGDKHLETQFFEIMDPESGEMIEYALPHDLYILAAMNQADASIESLDVAFLRRWEPFRLSPDPVALRAFYQLPDNNKSPLPLDPTSASDVFEASVRAWESINERIGLARGMEFQIGHGILFGNVKVEEMDTAKALDFVSIGWEKIRSHIDEIFFGDIRGVAATLNALEPPAYNPFKLEEADFAGELRYKLVSPKILKKETIYSLLRAITDIQL